MESRRLIARNLKEIRLSRRLSQEELAYIADVDQTYVSGLGRCVRNPSVDLLDRLAAVLKIKAIEFMAKNVNESKVFSSAARAASIEDDNITLQIGKKNVISRSCTEFLLRHSEI